MCSHLEAFSFLHQEFTTLIILSSYDVGVFDSHLTHFLGSSWVIANRSMVMHLFLQACWQSMCKASDRLVLITATRRSCCCRSHPPCNKGQESQ